MKKPTSMPLSRMLAHWAPTFCCVQGVHIKECVVCTLHAPLHTKYISQHASNVQENAPSLLMQLVQNDRLHTHHSPTNSPVHLLPNGSVSPHPAKTLFLLAATWCMACMHAHRLVYCYVEYTYGCVLHIHTHVHTHKHVPCLPPNFELRFLIWHVSIHIHIALIPLLTPQWCRRTGKFKYIVFPGPCWDILCIR